MATSIRRFVNAELLSSLCGANSAGVNRHIRHAISAQVFVQEITILRFGFDGDDFSGWPCEFSEETRKVADICPEIQKVLWRGIGKVIQQEFRQAWLVDFAAVQAAAHRVPFVAANA